VALTSFPGSHVDLVVLAFSALMIPPNLIFTIYQNRRDRARRRGEPAPTAPEDRTRRSRGG
jgi:hypothetical protein